MPRSDSSRMACAFACWSRAERDAVEMDLAVDDVDLEHRPAAQVLTDQIVELAQLLRDHRMRRRIGAHQPPQAGEALQHVNRIGRRGRRGRHRWRARSSRPDHACRALSATRTSAGFQKRNRSGTRARIAGSRSVVPACSARSSSRTGDLRMLQRRTRGCRAGRATPPRRRPAESAAALPRRPRAPRSLPRRKWTPTIPAARVLPMCASACSASRPVCSSPCCELLGQRTLRSRGRRSRAP